MTRFLATAVLCVFLTSASFGQDKPLTSDDVLRKSAEAYKAANTYYEEGTRTFRDMEEDADAVNVTTEFALGFKRGVSLLVRSSYKSIGSDTVGVHYVDASGSTGYSSHGNTYSRAADTLSDYVASAGLPDSFRFNSDPCAWISSHSKSISDLKTVPINGKDVYAISVDMGETAASSSAVSTRDITITDTYTLYFDKASFHIVGYDCETKCRASDPKKSAMNSDTRVSVRVSKLLANEAPKDASGKEMDVFAFRLPQGAKLEK